MTNRRDMLRTILFGSTALVAAACAKTDGSVGIPISVTIPPEVSQIVSDAQSIIDKGKALLNNPTVVGLISQAENLVSALKSGSGNAKSVVGTLAGVLGTVSGFLPPPYNIAAGVLVAMAKAFAGHPTAARLAMSPDEARRIMRS